VIVRVSHDVYTLFDILQAWPGNRGTRMQDTTYSRIKEAVEAQTERC